MADDEAALEPSCGRGHPAATVGTLKRHLEELRAALAEHGGGSPVQASSRYCQDFCRTLLEYAGCWKVEEDPLPLVEVYTVALLSYGQASEFLSQQCDNVPLVLERLSLSFIELLLSLKQEIPDGLWAELKSSVRSTHCRLQEISITQLDLLASLTQQSGVWTNSVLRALLSDQELPTEQVEEFLALEGPVLLEMRVKQLIKDGRPGKAALLAKICSEHPAFEGKGHFKQMRLVCLCTSLEQDQLMEELSKVDCRDALEMICNLESEGDEGAAFSLCSAFLTRQLLQGDTYCAWELTLFWSKLLKRLESSEQAFLDRCRQMSLLSKTVFHILFLIKVIQSEIATSGLPVCVEMCIRALQMESNDGNTKATICKTISCLLPTDLEVKRACQLTQFLLEPTVDAYYAVGTLYNEPDQKLDEQNMPVPNSLRCELLLVFKTQWPFDPEFWDWHTLKRHCLALMGEEASIVSSIDLLNDNESPVASGDEEEDTPGQESFRDVMAHFMDATNELRDITDKRQKNKEIKKLREKGFVSARFRNWQAYMQYCVLCDKEFLGHRIVRHAQTHFKDGLYNCPICVETFTSKDTLVPHVASHVKQSCKERLTAMKSSKKLANLKMGAPVIAALSAQTENQHHTAFGDSQGHSSGLTHTVQANSKLFHTEGGEGHICPVSSCRKGFKFSKNLLVHVRAHRDNEEATRYLEMHSNKVVCQYCRRHFVNVTHLNDHLQVHCGAKPYICIQLNCKASFLSNTELLVHRKEHSVFKARCMFPNCGNIFHEAFKLYDHEAQHYKTFTCKVADCGKIFHSQSQLDVHQGEHAAREVQCPVTEHQNSELGPSLIERMLSNPTPFAQQISQESKDLSSESHLLHDCRMVANSTERLLMTSQDPAQDFGQYSVNSELHDDTLPTVCQTQVSETSVIRSSANSHFSDPNGIVDVNSFDHLRAALLNQPMPHFDATAGNQSNAGHATQGQTQMFSNRNVRSVMYNPNCNVQFPQQSHSGPICATNISVAGPVQNNVPTTIAQPFPASVTPLTPSGIRQVNSVLNPVGSTPSAEQKERHYCAFETCTRNYGSYRSVNKHMKETHPEFYEKWKQAKRSGFLSAGPSRRGLPVGNPNLAPPRQIQPSNAAPMHGVQRQNVIQPPSFPNVAPTSCYTTPPSHLASVQNQNFPTTMENLLNPIVLSQLGSVANSVMTVHNQVVTAPPQWDLTSGNGQISNCASSQVYPSNMQGVSQMDSTGGALTVGIPLQPVLMENESQSPFPSYIDTSNTPSHQMAKTLQPLTFQSLNNSASNPMPPDMTMQKPVIQSDFPFPNVAGQASINAPSQNGMVNPGNVPVKQKKTRRHTRAKWPAIVRDGKFLCCRCFREFNSPKSLGGHLSKRSHCKPFGEEELVADLPASFLDLLNSEPTMNNIQLQPSAVYQERPCTTQSVARGLTDSKDFHASNYPQANLPAFTNEETHDDILKQIMADANMADLFEQPAVPQPLYHSPYEIVEAFPEISVIQHTGHVKAEKTEGELYTSPYPQSSVDPFASSNFQDPILSQVMSENLQGSPRPSHSAVPVPSGGILNECPTSSMTRQTTDVISNPVKQTLSPDPHHSPVSRSGKHGEMERKSAEETVKKRLREQILAGDFQHRNSLSHASTDANVCLKRPLSSVSNISVSKHSELNRVPQEAKTDTACGGQVEQLTHTTPSAFPGEFPRSVCTESFSGFREASSPQDDLLIPVIKAENEIDAAPTQLPPNQPQWVMEIQSALERLDLVKEMSSENALSSMKQSGITIQGENESVKVKSPMADTFPIFEKPFSCESDNCTFKAMSCEPLWKHLIKSHNYTLEMVNSFRQRQGNFARFCCQKCNKSFTRNSNLRAHYQSAHKLSPEEIADLNLKHKLYRATGHLNNQNNQMSGNMTQVAQTTAGSHITGKGTHQDVMTQNYPPQPFVQIGHMGVTNQRLHDDNHTTPIPPLQSGPMHNMQQSLSAGAQASTLAAQPLQTLPAAKWSDGRLGSVQTTPTQYLAVPQAGANLSTVPAALTLPPSAPIKAAVPQLLDQQTNLNKQHFACPNIERLNMEIAKKAKEKKPDSSSVFSPYRPYRCVHQGCLAAFTIQHNLILHYRAVHQSALSALEVSKEQDQSERAEASNDPEEEEEEEEEEEDDDEEAECEFIKVSEFRCQEKDCSRVFLEVPSLLQHYLHLHKFSLDRAGALLCSINLGRFSCDQPSCGASFTAFWKYIGHVKEVHSNSVLAKPEQVNGMFKCDIEDCDRAYATKSNLLRHTMKKHQEMYQLKLMNKKITEDAVKQNSKTPHYQLAKASNGKENIESNKKLTQKGVDKKRGDLSNNLHWTKYGKPSLKTKEEALAMCTKKFPLQYPCMIKGCEYVTKSERNIMKHYIGHGLSEKYLEEHRSNLLFCKKFSRYRYWSNRSDDSKSENTSDLSDSEDPEDAVLEGSDYRHSKPILRKRPASNDESFEGGSNVPVKRKRGRPRKLADTQVKRKSIPRSSTRNRVVYHADDDSDSSSGVAAATTPTWETKEPNAPLASFKPMGFEMSFLKFLEQKDLSKSSAGAHVSLRRKSPKDTCVSFSNRQNLESLRKVRILVDGSYSFVTELLLKQLQDMKPVVILEKND